MTFWQHFISNSSGPVEGYPLPEPDPRELEALDAYSNVVVRVAEMLRPAVVNLRSGRGRREGSGSGILFTPDGLLLTNHHVVAGSERVRVRLGDGREVGGRVVGNDPWTDLAIVQAEESNLPHATLGDSSRSARRPACCRYRQSPGLRVHRDGGRRQRPRAYLAQHHRTSGR